MITTIYNAIVVLYKVRVETSPKSTQHPRDFRGSSLPEREVIPNSVLGIEICLVALELLNKSLRKKI